MVDFYILQIKMGHMTVEDVPARWREEVKAKMKGENLNETGK